MPQLLLKNYSNIHIFFFLFFLTSCSNFKEEYSQINIYEYECGVSHQKILDKDFLTIYDKDFDKSYSVISRIIDTKINFIFSPGYRNSSGYSLDFLNLILKDKNLLLRFKENKPKKNSLVATVITYPFCVLSIDNVDYYNVSIELI